MSDFIKSQAEVRSNLIAQMREVIDFAEGEKRGLPAEETQKIERLEADIAQRDASIATAQRVEERSAQATEAAASFAPATAATSTDADPLASTRNGSLQLAEDARGLKVTATLPDTTLGRDIAELVRTGVIDAMSFGFSVKKDSWSQDGQTRYLEDVSLYEVSLVSTPAYEQTSGTVSVRSVDGISADVLADALLRIESGEELDPEQGKLVTEVIGKLTKTPEVEEVQGDILALKKKKLDLLMMGI